MVVSLAAGLLGALGAGVIVGFIRFGSFTNDVKHSEKALSDAAQSYANECAGHMKARIASQLTYMRYFAFSYTPDVQRRCNCAAVEIEAKNVNYLPVAQEILGPLEGSAEQVTPDIKGQIKAIGARYHLTDNELLEVLQISSAAVRACFAR